MRHIGVALLTRTPAWAGPYDGRALYSGYVCSFRFFVYVFLVSFLSWFFSLLFLFSFYSLLLHSSGFFVSYWFSWLFNIFLTHRI